MLLSWSRLLCCEMGADQWEKSPGKFTEKHLSSFSELTEIVLGTDVCSDRFVASLRTSEQVHQLFSTRGYLKGERVWGCLGLSGNCKGIFPFLQDPHLRRKG